MQVKQVIVMRRDLNMRKGKMIAQGSHASVACVLAIQNADTGIGWHGWLSEWLESSFKKICVSVDNETDLMHIFALAWRANLPVKLITDAGHTEFHGEATRTCLAIGPAPDEFIDKITGNLKLL